VQCFAQTELAFSAYWRPPSAGKQVAADRMQLLERLLLVVVIATSVIGSVAGAPAQQQQQTGPVMGIEDATDDDELMNKRDDEDDDDDDDYKERSENRASVDDVKSRSGIYTVSQKTSHLFDSITLILTLTL